MKRVPRLAALYDIHGNIDALDAALREIDRAGIHDVVVGGDVAYGPFVREALDRLEGLGTRAHWIRGNADRELVESMQGQALGDEELRTAAAWEAGRLTEAHRRRLAGLPTTLRFEVEGLGVVLFCHGSPRSDEEILTAISPLERIREALAGIQADVVVCGHTHVPFDRTALGLRIVNAGSVGLPYDERGAPWLELGPSVGARRAVYDVERAVERIFASGHPLADSFVQVLREPPGASVATETFEARARAKTTG